eukprot:5605035-Pyramimonas_sp.AAC.1
MCPRLSPREPARAGPARASKEKTIDPLGSGLIRHGAWLPRAGIVRRRPEDSLTQPQSAELAALELIHLPRGRQTATRESGVELLPETQRREDAPPAPRNAACRPDDDR